jgi:hypothetical protein
MELGHTPKRESILYNMTSSMQILKNSEVREVIVSSVQIDLHGSVSRHLAESGLTIITFGNCISSWILGDSVFMST